MWMQIIAGVGWLVWLSSGSAGLNDGLTVGAFLVLGFGLKKILDTFWNQKTSGGQAVEVGAQVEAPSRFLPRKQGNLPSPNWNNSPVGGSGDASILRRFERRYADPRA